MAAMSMSAGGRLRTAAQKAAIDEVMRLATSTNKKGVLMGFDLAARLTPERHRYKVRIVRDKVAEDHPAYELVCRVIRDFAPNARERFIQSFIMNGMLLGARVREEYFERDGYEPPFVVLISPTMRCNLTCSGCYAAEYPMDRDMSRETMQRIVDEGSEMGTYLYTILGGEPFIREDLLDFCGDNPDCYFQVFTNGTLLDDAVVERMAEVGNLAPMLSIEGDRETTDGRRGPGIYDQQMQAMDLLKDAGLPFGYSVTVTRANWRTLVGDEFVDRMIEKGAVIGWHFLYMPVGRCPDTAPMLEPRDRNDFRLEIERIRQTKPLFTVDFWGDAPYVGGCIAGKYYLHITSDGWVEPCIFAHFATNNINDTSLYDAFASPFFKEIRRRQPFNENLLMPCMLIDNPHHSREIVELSGAQPTHPGADAYFNELRDELDDYASEVKRVYEPIWSCMDGDRRPPH